MTANLEVYLVVVGVLHVPDHVDGVALQPIGHGQIKVVGIGAMGVDGVVQGERHALSRLVDEREVHVAGKSVAFHVVAESIDAIGVFPQSAHDGEQQWRVAWPVAFVGLP